MSKEQTPITTEDFFNEKAEGIGFSDFYNLVSNVDTNRITFLTKKWSEQYAKAKVLEALEVLKTLTDNNVIVTSEHIQNLIDNTTKQK